MDIVTTLITVPAILGAVNVMKSYGMPAKASPIISILLGVLFAAVASFIQFGNPYDPQLLMLGVVTGISATGLYDVTKSPAGKMETEAQPDGTVPAIPVEIVSPDAAEAPEEIMG